MADARSPAMHLALSGQERTILNQGTHAAVLGTERETHRTPSRERRVRLCLLHTRRTSAALPVALFCCCCLCSLESTLLFALRCRRPSLVVRCAPGQHARPPTRTPLPFDFSFILPPPAPACGFFLPAPLQSAGCGVPVPAHTHTHTHSTATRAGKTPLLLSFRVALALFFFSPPSLLRLCALGATAFQGGSLDFLTPFAAVRHTLSVQRGGVVRSNQALRRSLAKKCEGCGVRVWSCPFSSVCCCCCCFLLLATHLSSSLSRRPACRS